MKKLTLLFAAVGMFCSFQAAHAQNVEKEMMIGISEVYVPDAQTTQDNAFVMVSGIFQNGCYKWSRSVVNHRSDFYHEVTSYAMVRAGACIMVLLPFNQKVELGQLKAGQHRIRFLNGDDTFVEKQMTIQ